ncbi:MAG TPA: hypothetical protein VI278_04985, partial [Nitrososphaeraceae archaeon]
KIFLASNAIRGLAQYRALQSRLSPTITCVESFEVLKLGLGRDFQLLSSSNENMLVSPKIKNSLLPDDMIECNYSSEISYLDSDKCRKKGQSTVSMLK